MRSKFVPAVGFRITGITETFVSRRCRKPLSKRRFGVERLWRDLGLEVGNKELLTTHYQHPATPLAVQSTRPLRSERALPTRWADTGAAADPHALRT